MGLFRSDISTVQPDIGAIGEVIQKHLDQWDEEQEEKNIEEYLQ